MLLEGREGEGLGHFSNNPMLTFSYHIKVLEEV